MSTDTMYILSVTGVHGAGKKTLRDALARTADSFVAIDYKLLKLGRMVDEEGLWTFRDRCLEQDRFVKEMLASDRSPVTSRLGILDVAVLACAMVRLGRIDEGVVGRVLQRLEADLPSLSMPKAVVALWAPPHILQERLIDRDQRSDTKPSRSAGKLGDLVALTAEIFLDRRYPHPLIERIVEPYRRDNLLLALGSGELDPDATRDRTVEFLRECGLFPKGVSTPAS